MAKKKFDRSRFKTSNSLAQQEAELADKIKSNNFPSTPGWIETKDDGDYILRLYPTYVEDSYFMLPSMVHYLDMELDKYVDGELVMNGDTPVREVRKSTVFNSRIHGDTEDDIVEAYIEFVEKLASEKYGEDTRNKERKTFLKHVYGHREGGKYVGGIKGTVDYVAYASLMVKNNDDNYIEKDFGRVRLKTSVRNQMLTLASEGDGGAGLAIDPFTDPDEGMLVKITKDSVAGKLDPSNYYHVSFASKRYVPIVWPLPEGFESKYEDLKTLDEIYKNVYTFKTFNNAIDGLTRFDEKHNYDVFGHEDFLDTCERISEYYPEGDEEQEDAQEAPTEKATEEKPAEEVVKEKTHEEPIEEKVAEKAAEVVEEDEPPFKTKSVKGKVSASDKLQQLKAKMAKNKK